MAGKKVAKGLTAVIVIVSVVFSLGANFWARGKALGIPGPSFFKITPDNQLAVVIGQEILFYREGGALARQLQVADLELESHGDIGFFANGDLLIYSGSPQLSFLEQMARLLRLTPTSQQAPPPSQGLHRCDLQALRCQLFTSALPEFRTAFRLAVDRNTDTVFVADTPRHRLYQLSSDGDLLAQLTTGLRFPNAIVLDDGELLVADTNNFVIKSVDVADNDFGVATTVFQTLENDQIKRPANLSQVNDQWWVTVTDNNMTNGIVVRYNEKGQRIGAIELPGNADPLDLAYFDDRVWVADFNNINLYQYNSQGDSLGEVGEPNFQALRSELLTNKAKYQQLESVYLYFFIGIIIAGIVVAILLEGKQGLTQAFNRGGDALAQADDNYEELPHDRPVWLTQTPTLKKIKQLAGPAMIGGMALTVLAMALTWDLGWRAQLIMGAMLPLFFILYRMLTDNFKVRLGVRGEHVIVQDADGRIVTGSKNNLYYTPHNILLDGMVLPLGNPRQRIYPEDELKRWVFPRLHRNGNKVGELQMYKLMWQEGAPLIRQMLMLLGYLLILAALLYYLDVSKPAT